MKSTTCKPMTRPLKECTPSSLFGGIKPSPREVEVFLVIEKFRKPGSLSDLIDRLTIPFKGSNFQGPMLSYLVMSYRKVFFGNSTFRISGFEGFEPS
jgi:hypothetical protein